MIEIVSTEICQIFYIWVSPKKQKFIVTYCCCLCLRNLWIVTNTCHAFLKATQMSLGAFIVQSTQSCLTLQNLMDYSTPGFPVLHHLLELAQTHVHWISDAIQPSHPLSYPSLPTFNLSQHQCLFQGVSSSHQVAKVLEFQLQHQSFQVNIQDWSPLGWTVCISLQSKGLSRVFSNTTVQNHQFFGAQFFFYSPTLTSIHD